MLDKMVNSGLVYVNGDGCFIVHVWVTFDDVEDHMVVNLGSNEKTAEILAYALIG